MKTRYEVEELVGRGESETVEFKRSTGELREALQTVCAFLNHLGGVVVIGVTGDGSVAGQDVTDKTLREIGDGITHLDPSPKVDITTVPVSATKSVVLLTVEPGDAMPYTYDGGPYVRLASTTRRMRREDYERKLLRRLHARYRWETLPALGWKVEDLDADEIRLAVSDAVAAPRLAPVPTEDVNVILERLGLLTDGQLTQAAVLRGD